MLQGLAVGSFLLQSFRSSAFAHNRKKLLRNGDIPVSGFLTFILAVMMEKDALRAPFFRKALGEQES